MLMVDVAMELGIYILCFSSGMRM